MVEIPEHLLKKSKAAKAAATGSPAPADSSDDTATTTDVAASSTAVAAASTPAIPTADLPYLDPEPEPEREEPGYVTAANKRKKIPYWAMPVFLATPVWAYGLAGTLQEPVRDDPLTTQAAELYTALGCAGCHGGNGGGGSGYQLSDGEVLQTFAEPIDMMVHVARGSAAIAGEDYGNERANGQRRISGQRGVMPAQIEALSLTELELVVYHERHILSGEDNTPEAYHEWEEHLREAAESGVAEEIDLDFLLACANPEVTPGATGVGSDDPEGQPCPGPHADKEEASEE